jgi:hypothetical protein
MGIIKWTLGAIFVVGCLILSKLRDILTAVQR